MNKYLFIFMLMAGTAGFSKAKAQSPATPAAPADSTIVPAALARGNYPLSVIFKVSDVTSLVHLTDAQQVSLADLFTQADQAIADSTAGGATYPQLEALRAGQAARFQALLTSNQLAAYSAARPNSYLAAHSYSAAGTPPRP